jgi:hypothetical protein
MRLMLAKRVFQGLALLLSIGLLTVLACRAQQQHEPAPLPASKAGPVMPGANSADFVPDAALPDAPPADVYFPASKSGPVIMPGTKSGQVLTPEPEPQQKGGK